MNGSGVWIASTWPFASAAGIVGNGIVANFTEFESMPSLSSGP